MYAGRDPVTGRHRQVSKTVEARNRTLALKALRTFATETQSLQVVPTAVTVKDLLERWTTEFLPGEGKAPSTVESYALVTKKHLIPALGHVQLKELTAYHLDRYYRAKQKGGMAPRTVRQHHAILSSALTQAVAWGWLDRSPAPRAKPPKAPRGMGFIPAIEQVRLLLSKAAGDVELETAVALAALTGARRGELAGLRWSDIDWNTGTLLIERQRVPLKGGDRTVPLKHGERHTVALGQFGVAVLKRYQAHTEAQAARLGVEPDWAGWLISKTCGRSPMRAKVLGDSISELGRKAKVPVTTHAFRRFAATQMLAAVDVRTAAGRLGNSPEMLLRKYAGFLPSRDEAAAELLGAAIGSAGLAPNAKKPSTREQAEG